MKINFVFAPRYAWSEVAANIAHNRELGLGFEVECPSERVAVVGGNPFVAEHVATLRNWDGEVWAINGTWRWCQDQGIDATAFTIDSGQIVAQMFSGASRALISNQVYPGVHAAFADGALVGMFEVGEGAVEHGTTTATAAAHLAILRGHRSVTWFGCAGSYADDGRTHVDRREATSLLRVAVGSQTFLTNAKMLDQSLWLSDIIRKIPSVYAECSGGLLSALIEAGDYEIVAASRDIHDAIRQAA